MLAVVAIETPMIGRKIPSVRKLLAKIGEGLPKIWWIYYSYLQLSKSNKLLLYRVFVVKWSSSLPGTLVVVGLNPTRKEFSVGTVLAQDRNVQIMHKKISISEIETCFMSTDEIARIFSKFQNP